MKVHMKKMLLIISSCYVFSLIACAQQKQGIILNEADTRIAFPGAEGFGKFTTGGRAGKYLLFPILMTMDREASGWLQKQREPHYCLCHIRVLFILETKLNIKGRCKHRGSIGSRDGICLADNSVSLGGDNIIVRYLRFRMGDKYQKGGMVDGNGGDDAFGGIKKEKISSSIIAALELEYDEVFSVYAGDSTTLQWNMISEPLNYSYHLKQETRI
jgi:hypothetical protein